MTGIQTIEIVFNPMDVFQAVVWRFGILLKDHSQKSDIEARWEIFRAPLPYYGKIVRPDFIKKNTSYNSRCRKNS